MRYTARCEKFAELPCKVSIPHTNISQVVHVAASIAMLEAVVIVVAVSFYQKVWICLKESVSVSISVTPVVIKLDIEQILCLN